MNTNINGEELLKKIEKIRIKLASDKSLNSYDFSKMKSTLSMVETEITNMMLGNKFKK